MKFCPQCGKELTEKSLFCPHCYHRFKSDIRLPVILAAIFTAALALVAVYQTKAVGDTYLKVIDSPLYARRSMLVFQREFAEERRLITTIAAYTGIDGERCEYAYKDGTERHQYALDALDEAAVASTTEAQMRAIGELREYMRSYKEFLDETITAARSGDREGVFMITEIGASIAVDIKASAAEFLDNSAMIAESIIKDADKRANNAVQLTIAGSAAFITVMFAASFAYGNKKKG